MNFTSTVVFGQAALFSEGLRFLSPMSSPDRPLWRHLLAKWSASHQIAGKFKCSKGGCKQDEIVVELR